MFGKRACKSKYELTDVISDNSYVIVDNKEFERYTVDKCALLALIGRNELGNWRRISNNFNSMVGIFERVNRQVRVVSRIINKENTVGYCIVDIENRKEYVSREELAYLCGKRLVANCEVCISLEKGNVKFRGTNGTKLDKLPVERRDGRRTKVTSALKDMYPNRVKRDILVDGKRVNVERETFGMLLALGFMKKDSNGLQTYGLDARIIAGNTVYKLCSLKSHEDFKYRTLYLVEAVNNKNSLYLVREETLGYLMTKGRIENIFIDRAANIVNGKVEELHFGYVGEGNRKIKVK